MKGQVITFLRVSKYNGLKFFYLKKAALKGNFQIFLSQIIKYSLLNTAVSIVLQFKVHRLRKLHCLHNVG